MRLYRGSTTTDQHLQHRPFLSGQSDQIGFSVQRLSFGSMAGL